MTSYRRPQVVNSRTAVMDECQRRLQQDFRVTTARLTGSATPRAPGPENLTVRQRARPHSAFADRAENAEGHVAYRAPSKSPVPPPPAHSTAGRASEEKENDTFYTCPIHRSPASARPLRSLAVILGDFASGGASNGGSRATTSLIELTGVDLGFRNRDDYRLRALLSGGERNV